MLIDWLLRPPHFGLFAEKEGGDVGEGAGDEGSGEFEDLVKEGEDLLEQEGEEETKEEGGEETEETPPDADLRARLDAVESKVAEKDAEIVFLRGQVARQQAPKAEDKKDEGFKLDRKYFMAKLYDKDPDVAFDAMTELVDKLSEQKAAKLRDETRSYVAGNDVVRSSMEADRASVLADFEYAEDDNPHQELFMKALEENYNNLRRAAGVNYIKGGLYQAAATAKLAVDRELAKRNGTKNGVTPRRPATTTSNAVESSTGDYSKAKTISAIPDSALAPREKAAAKAFVKRLGITEKEWIENWAADNKENA